MSPRWLEQVCVTLSPQAVGCGRRSVLHMRQGQPHTVVPVADAAARATAWRPAIEVLRGWVPEAAKGRADVRVVLSNHFVRFLVAPWNESLSSFGERRAVAEQHFRARYGSLVDGWRVHVSPTGHGEPAIACAIDAELLDALASLFAATPWRLVSVQPLLVVAFNQFRRSLGDDACLFVREPGRLCCAAWHKGRWQAIRATRVLADCGEACLEREREVLGVAEDVPAFVYDVSDPFALAPGNGAWRALSTSSTRRPDAALALFAQTP